MLNINFIYKFFDLIHKIGYNFILHRTDNVQNIETTPAIKDIDTVKQPEAPRKSSIPPVRDNKTPQQPQLRIEESQVYILVHS